MRRWLLALVLMLVAQAAMAQVVVRTTLEPKEGVVLGQPVRVLVDVLFPGEMERPPRVTLPDTPGAQILRYESQATTLNERIDGEPRTGQRFEFAFYPRRGGTLEVPAPQVVTFDRAGAETGRLSGTSMKIEVTVPPGVDPSRPVVAARGFVLEESWRPDPAGTFKLGDALVRTIVRHAPGLPGMAMLDLDFPAPAGVRVYTDPPQTDDRVLRGDLTGQRTDKVTYVFERGGSFPIEAVVQPWWDLSANRLRRAEGKGVTVAVTAVAPAATPRANVPLYVFAVTTVAGLVFLGLWALPRLRFAIARRRAAWAASEAHAFQELENACRGDDLAAIYRAFTTWRRRAANGASLAPFAEEIEGAVFASHPWSHRQSQEFVARLTSERVPQRQRKKGCALPLLNPVNFTGQLQEER
jgi:hypothetical protein